MKKRCGDPKYREFHLYGGRGIVFVPSWSNYEGFKAWALESGWKPGLTIERKDVNGNYEPTNCIFVPPSEQSQNRRKRETWRDGLVTSSRWKGVTFKPADEKNRTVTDKWISTICLNQVQIFLGHFANESEAAFAYNVASQRLFNAWAVRNEIPEGLLTEEMKVSIADRVNRLLDQKQLVS